jgi:hypothetical protein
MMIILLMIDKPVDDLSGGVKFMPHRDPDTKEMMARA